MIHQDLDVAALDFRVAHLCRLHHSRAHVLLEAIGLYRGQPPVLFALWEQEGLSHAELAAKVHVTPPTLSRMVQRMTKAGLLLTKDDPEDQRVSRVYLTDAGRAIRGRVDHTWAQLGAETLAGFTAEEKVQVSCFLERMAANLELVDGAGRSCKDTAKPE